MTTPLPDQLAAFAPTFVAHDALKEIVRAYGAAEYKRGTEALQAVTAERDALKADAERYRFIHTRPEWLGWDEDFDHRDIDAIVDRSMKGTS